jgi:predicted kinase
MSLQATLTVGLPASGKSYWATQQVVAGEGNIVNINRDDIRRMLFGSCRGPVYNFTRHKEKIVTRVAYGIAEESLNSNKHLIISDTNLSPSSADTWKEWLTERKVTVRFKSFLDVPLKTLLERDALRAEGVGKDVIMEMWNKYIVPTLSVSEEPQYKPNNDLPTAFVVDIDGTIASMAGKRGPFEWDKVDQDDPYYDTLSLVLTLYHVGHKIIVMSGRDEVCRDKTAEWLDRHGVPYSELYMRKQGDQRKDSIIKLELFWEHVATKFKVVGVLDDRQQVVDAWRSIGLRCYQVAPGNF